MKRLALLSLAALSIAAIPSGPTSITLLWDNQPEYGTNTTIKLYHSTSLGTPLQQWTVVSSVVDTNMITVQVDPGVHFYYVTASNFWGESDPSNVALTPPLPQSGKLQIKLGGK